MRNGKTMTFRVNGLDSESTRFDGTPGRVRVAASGYGDKVSFRTDAKSAPAIGARLKVTVEWGDDDAGEFGYLQGLAEGPGWSGVSPMPGDKVLAAIRLREMPDGEISWPTLGRAVFGDEGLHERRDVVAELAALIDPGPGICIGTCPECGCPYDEGWSYCCQCGERLPDEGEWKRAEMAGKLEGDDA